jgi:hypothetical protein
LVFSLLDQHRLHALIAPAAEMRTKFSKASWEEDPSKIQITVCFEDILFELDVGITRLYSCLEPGPQVCHSTTTKHIRCTTSTHVGDVFVFDLHKNYDCEASSDAANKQRNEIKAYDPSPNSLKGFYGETMTYTWKFRVDALMQISSKFTHIFQLKFVGGDDGMPRELSD